MADNLFDAAPEKRDRWFWGKSRGARRVDQNLGIIPYDGGQYGKAKFFRSTELEIYDAYYESRQYNHLTPWLQATSCDGEYIPIRKRKPHLNFQFSKTLAQRLTAKLIGQQTFPTLKIEEDPDTQEYLRYIIKAGKLKSRLLEPTRRHLISGSVLVRFYIDEGSFVVEHYLSKYCYPVLKANGELSSVMVKYAFQDQDDRKENGDPKWKWFRLDLGEMEDVLYVPAEFNPDQPDQEPNWQVQEVTEHELGFVQAQWFRTAELRGSPDGVSLICDILGFIDEINYSLSQSSQAVSYNQDPQLVINGMDEDDVKALIRSSQKAWVMGKDGEGKFLEAGLQGVERAQALRDSVKLGLQDVTRIVMHDPDKVVGSAQSGKAMEILMAPMVELVQELRPMVGDGLKGLVLKMALANLILSNRGDMTPVQIPQGFSPKSFDIEEDWPPIFPMTIEDLQKKVSVANSAAGASIISRETATRWVAKDFGVEDVEAEVEKIAAQPVLNPFGSF